MEEWEVIQEGKIDITERLKVYGGWLVKYLCNRTGESSMVFVPDVHHAWKISKEKCCQVSGVKIDY